MATTPSRVRLHTDWINMLQPDGLVVAAPVLDELDLYVRRPVEVQQRLRALTPDARLPDLDTLLSGLLEWPDARVTGPTDETTAHLVDLGVSIAPDRVLRDRSGAPVAFAAWSPDGLDVTPPDATWLATREERFQRLLLDRKVPVGVHACPTEVRLTYCPPGEAPGLLTFPVEALHSADGRVLVDALLMLLHHRRFTAPAGKRLLDALQQSRKRQEQVTDALAGQVEDALRILLSGFDTANRRTDGALLRDVPPGEVYEGLVTVLLRLVFLLYAEDRELMPVSDGLYQQHYAVTGLAEQLSADAVKHASAMDLRFGAWARLLTLFRLVARGGRYGGMVLPPRRGDLFDPMRHPFLEGRPRASRSEHDPVAVPPVDDGTVHRVLDRLVHLDGQRISFRNLEVEQLGSVYEALMGFTVERAEAPGLTVRHDGQRFGVVLDRLRDAADPLRALADALGDKPARLRKKLPDLAAFAPTDDLDADRRALAHALAPITDPALPPLAAGDHVLQPGEERRRSGSHYTPRALTEPIVERTLGPVLDDGGPPTPEQILSLKVCDPAMGSGAFLAEACRYLGRRLVEAWARTDTTPPQALERADAELYARRLVAERCLYGVDKNPRAVHLARLSLWLVTSAADLPFTFVDHALKEGDALVGLDSAGLAALSFHGGAERVTSRAVLDAAIQSASRLRAQIVARQQALVFDHDQKKTFLHLADEEVWDERRLGDLVVGCAWAGGSRKAMEKRLDAAAERARAWYPNEAKDPLPGDLGALVNAVPFRPFHWPLEFPEVFGRKNPGFDCVVGNPPFLGGTMIKTTYGAPYRAIVEAIYPSASRAADLAAYFFLRAEQVLRKGGTFGLVSTNSINEGDTRRTGLATLVNGSTTLYDATKDVRWPVSGAAVTVSIVHGAKERKVSTKRLDGREVKQLNSALEPLEELPDPVKLGANKDLVYQGVKLDGVGFALDWDHGAALIAEDPKRAAVLRPYITGEDLNSSPTSEPRRYVIDFDQRTLDEARRWPTLLGLAEERVKPQRATHSEERCRRNWWLFQRTRPELRQMLTEKRRVLACSRHSKHALVGFQSADQVFSEALVVFAFDDSFHFALLQSRTHEHWARAMGSTLGMGLRYTPSRCFETFPFPRPTDAQRRAVAEAGEALYTLRSEIMVRDQQGMTQVWNRLHDDFEQDPDILRLRELRDAMDRAVLDAYGWGDLDPDDRDGILVRLRKLNAARAAAEARPARRKKARSREPATTEAT